MTPAEKRLRELEKLRAQEPNDIRALKAQGWTVVALAEITHSTRGRIYRILADTTPRKHR